MYRAALYNKVFNGICHAYVANVFLCNSSKMQTRNAKLIAESSRAEFLSAIAIFAMVMNYK